MILSCAIIDDEPLAADLLASYASKTPELHLVGTYESALTAMKVLRENPVNLLFLDIQMPELSGLEFAKILPKDTKVIFTTAFDRYAIEGYKVNAVDYLLKPISYENFIKAVNKTIELSITEHRQQVMAQDRFLYVKSEYKLVQVKLDDILYVEGVKDYIKLYLKGDRRPILSLMNMKKIDDYLPRPQFMRIHRSYIINMKEVSMIDRSRMVIGDNLLPVSESYKDLVQEFLDSHTLQ